MDDCVFDDDDFGINPEFDEEAKRQEENGECDDLDVHDIDDDEDDEIDDSEWPF